MKDPPDSTPAPDSKRQYLIWLGGFLLLVLLARPPHLGDESTNQVHIASSIRSFMSTPAFLRMLIG